MTEFRIVVELLVQVRSGGREPMPCFLVCIISQYSESPWIISPTKLSKASEFLIRLALDATDPAISSLTFIENIFHFNSAAGGAAEFSAEGAECSPSNSRPSPSTF